MVPDIHCASHPQALYDTVPHGQWVPLDMDISGIWRYSNNYSFFGAPFIWTTLHNMGGNDGLKGDMRMLQHMPSDALAAGASIIGTGATPEGIDQNPPYYEYAYDTAWHAEPQPLEQWFAEYPVRRYGFLGGCEGKAGCDEATTAWGILLDQVYHSEVRCLSMFSLTAWCLLFVHPFLVSAVFPLRPWPFCVP